MVAENETCLFELRDDLKVFLIRYKRYALFAKASSFFMSDENK